MGEAPLRVLLYSSKRMPGRPRMLRGLGYALGWTLGGVDRVAEADQPRGIRCRDAHLGWRVGTELRL